MKKIIGKNDPYIGGNNLNEFPGKGVTPVNPDDTGDYALSHSSKPVEVNPGPSLHVTAHGIDLHPDLNNGKRCHCTDTLT